MTWMWFAETRSLSSEPPASQGKKAQFTLVLFRGKYDHSSMFTARHSTGLWGVNRVCIYTGRLELGVSCTLRRMGEWKACCVQRQSQEAQESLSAI